MRAQAHPATDPIVTELLRARKAKGLRQQDVADRAGLSRRALSSIESGGDCTLSTVRSLARVLGVHLEATVAPQERPLHRSFASAPEMDAYQLDRELEEALRVQLMQPGERAKWLSSTWGHLQEQARSFQAGSIPGGPRAIHFPDMPSKNRFDEERETRDALQLALSRGAV